mgnify:CR=1 FL=1
MSFSGREPPMRPDGSNVRYQHQPAHRGALTSPAVYGWDMPVNGPAERHTKPASSTRSCNPLHLAPRGPWELACADGKLRQIKRCYKLRMCMLTSWLGA